MSKPTHTPRFSERSCHSFLRAAFRWQPWFSRVSRTRSMSGAVGGKLSSRSRFFSRLRAPHLPLRVPLTAPTPPLIPIRPAAPSAQQQLLPRFRSCERILKQPRIVLALRQLLLAAVPAGDVAGRHCPKPHAPSFCSIHLSVWGRSGHRHDHRGRGNVDHALSVTGAAGWRR